jgi:hypothetical protein
MGLVWAWVEGRQETKNFVCWMRLAPLVVAMKSLVVALFGIFVLSDASVRGAEAFEVASGGEAELPQGREADGIRGDFILRNEKIAALISQNAPLRRANMSTFYGANGVTPGCLYDLTLRQDQNDQLTCFCPAGQRGEVSWVRIVPEKDSKRASVETVVTAAKNAGVYKRHEYRLRDGEQGLWIITTLRNESNEKQKVNITDEWVKFNETGEEEGIRWANAVNPDDRCGYALGKADLRDIKETKMPEGESKDLSPKQEVTWTRFLAVGRSPLEAWGVVKQAQGAKLDTISYQLKHTDGSPVLAAKLTMESKGGISVPAQLDLEGKTTFGFPTGKRSYIIDEIGGALPGPSKITFETEAGGTTHTPSTTVPPPTRLKFAINREDGTPVPCKAQILATGNTKPVDLGPTIRAHGCKDQYFSEDGHFSVQVPAGTYHIVVTHGIEYSHHEQDITLTQGQEMEIKATLKRLLDTTGWVSCDFHNHTTQSGDNVCGLPDRLIGLAAENIEFAPTTEHNRIYDWRPTIEKLNLLSEIQTVVGMELTGAAAHLNCFPLTVEPFLQDNGAPVWNPDPRISALLLRDWQGERDDRWIQINHPDLQFLFNDRNKRGKPDGGFKGIDQMVNGMETENFAKGEILADSPWKLSKPKGALATQVTYVRQFIWLQLLNLGYRITPVAVSDAHTVFGNGVGGWRMYLPSKTDEPAKIDWTGDLAAHAKAGHVMLTTGPFLQVTTADGKLPGDDVKAAGGVELHVKVQCTDWQDIDRVQVLVNGRKEPSLNFTRKTHPQMFQDGVVKFDQTISVPLKADAHVIVVATHETMTLKTGYGSSDQSSLHPMAYHAPFYVDVNGDGFKANGDTLGFDLPVMKMTVDQVRKNLGLPVPEEEKAKPEK